MDKRWYPVAVSALIVSCGGDVDSGSPAATGGLYPWFYGPLPIFTGGSSSTSGGATSFGGTAAVGGSTSTVGVRACLADSDCTQCPYITAPTSSGECANALGCCGGQVMNQTACASNQAAWETYCSGQGYTAPICPCILPCTGTSVSCSPSCKNGECGFW